MISYDLCVIGAGSGGIRAARMAANLGIKTAIIEEGRYGGTCVNLGCVPKKYCVIAAEFEQLFQLSKDYGWNISGQNFSLKHLKQARDKTILRLNGVYRSLLDSTGVISYQGKAMLLGQGKVAIGEEIIKADKILIATGSQPFIPPELNNSELAMISDQVFDLEELPSSLAVYGGGYIAVEFACIFNALGVETHLVYRGDRLLKNFDTETVSKATKIFCRQGIHLHLQASITGIHKSTTGLSLTLNSNNRISHIDTEQLLLATGRVANTKNMGLDKAGVKTKESGLIYVDTDYQTSVPGIYALGDVSGGAQLTPMAIAEAMDFIRQHYQPASSFRLPHHVPTVIFSIPNIASVGLSEEAARNKHDIDIYKSDFRPLLYSLGEHKEQKYFIKVIVDRSNDLVIGVHMAGEGSGEIIQGFAAAMEAGITKKELDRTLCIHPTTAEELVSLYEPAHDD